MRFYFNSRLGHIFEAIIVACSIIYTAGPTALTKLLSQPKIKLIIVKFVFGLK